MTLVEHAERELALAGVAGDDGYDGMLYEAVLEIVKKFADQGHSGFSASMTVGMLDKLLRYEPLTPLSGEDDEWMEVGEGVYQNFRASHVFKESDGTAYDIHAVIVRDPHGGTWGTRSRDPIEFPYTPEQTVVDIDAHGRTKDRSLSKYDVQGFCGDDDCHCWTGGEKLKLDGDDDVTDE